jgi:Na+/melibiose symporter-like transporter
MSRGRVRVGSKKCGGGTGGEVDKNTPEVLPLHLGSAMLGEKRKMLNNSSTESLTFRRRDYVKITIFGLALSALWGSLHSVILPLRLLDFVAESQKNTYLGLLTLTGLLLAMAYQPIAGAISDRSTFRWGRRRPYILMGSLAALLLIPGIGFVGSYATIFLVYCLLQLSTNTAQGPYQAFIPDLAPDERRGTASGVKTLLELIGGIGLVYIIIILGSRFLGEGNAWIWLVMAALWALMLAALLITVITVKERPGTVRHKQPLLPTLYKSYKIDISKSPSFILFLVSRLLFIMALTTLQSFALYFFRDMVKVANPTTATVELMAALGVGMLASVYPAGRLSDRLGRKPVLISSGLIGAAGILMLLLGPSYGYILIGGTLQGIAVGSFMCSNWALATDLVPKSEEARYLGLTNLATAGGAALARLIGIGIDFFNGYSPGLGYKFMLLVCFVYFIAGSALIAKLKTRG